MMKRILLAATLVMFVSPAFSQQDDGQTFLAEWDWQMSATSYAIAGMCAQKRLAFSSGDVEKLKKIAVEKAKSVTQARIDEMWDSILFAVTYAPPTAEQCFKAFDEADFTGKGGLGMWR